MIRSSELCRGAAHCRRALPIVTRGSPIVTPGLGQGGFRGLAKGGLLLVPYKYRYINGIFSIIFSLFYFIILYFHTQLEMAYATRTIVNLGLGQGGGGGDLEFSQGEEEKICNNQFLRLFWFIYNREIQA